MNLARNVIMTGASGSIGRSIAARLVQCGCSVVGLGRRAVQLGADDATFTHTYIDLADLEVLPEVLQRLTHCHSEADTIICAAGVGRFGSLEEFSIAQIRHLVDVNLTSQVCVIRAFLPLLKRRGGGDVVVIGSEAALTGGARGAIYSATKFALRGFTQSLRQECAKVGVRVTLINPGMVRSGFFEDLAFEPGEDAANAIVPEDVAGAVELVLSARPETVIDEINLSPLKKVVRRKTD